MMLAKEKAKKEGIEQGIENEKIGIAKNMIKENIDLNLISKVTGLTIDEIKAL